MAVKNLPKDYIITNVDVMEDRLLGEGAYGVVKLGTYYGLLCAVKKLKPSMFPSGMHHLDQQTELILQSFFNECDKLSRIRHPNVVQLLGVFSDSHNRLPVIVMELMNESLSRLLHRTKVLPFHVDVNIVHDVSQALAYLHSFQPPIVHRDLSSNNILLSENLRAKITDLGVAKVAKGSFLSWDNTPAPGTLAYMPPEVRKVPADLTPAMDIFALGVNMIQIKTHVFPRPGPEFSSGRLGFSKMVPEKERRRDHLDLISRNDPLKAILLNCIKDNPRDRPSGMKLCERLQKIKGERDYLESSQMEKAKNSVGDGKREHIFTLEGKIAELTEELANKTSEVERLEKELDRERIYTSQVMEQSAREKLKFDITLACLSTSKVDDGSINGVTDPTTTTTTTTTTTNTDTKKKKKFKLKKIFRRSHDLPKKNGKDPKRSLSLSKNGQQNTSNGSDLVSISESSDHEKKSIRKQIKFKSAKLSATTETYVDITEVVVEEEDDDEEEEEGGSRGGAEMGGEKVKPLSERTKHDYKMNRLTWYTHNCLPASLHGNTLRVHQFSDQLCVCGGILEDGAPNRSLLYCPTKNLTRWSRASSDVPQYLCASVVIQNEVVLISGISAVDGKCTGALSSYDFNARIWVQRYPPIPTPRSSASAFIYADYLVVMGGHDEEGEVSSTVEALYIPTQVWETASRLPVPVAGASTVVCCNTVYLVGGIGQKNSDIQSVQSALVSKILSSCRRFSILSSLTSEFMSSRNIWKLLHDCPFTKMTAMCSGNQLLAFGGEQVTKSAHSEPAEWIWIYDQTDNTWSPIQGMPSPRKLCGVAMLPDNNVVVIGGDPDFTKIDIAEII